MIVRLIRMLVLVVSGLSVVLLAGCSHSAGSSAVAGDPSAQAVKDAPQRATDMANQYKQHPPVPTNP